MGLGINYVILANHLIHPPSSQCFGTDMYIRYIYY